MSANLITAGYAVERIIRDLTSRKGLGDAWDEIDPQTQRDIEQLWVQLILRAVV